MHKQMTISMDKYIHEYINFNMALEKSIAHSLIAFIEKWKKALIVAIFFEPC